MKNVERKILKILHEEGGPLKLGEIAAKLNKEKNTTHYYLKKLTDPERKTLESKDGYYWIGDREKVKKAILDLLAVSEFTKTNLFQELMKKGFTEDEIYDALFLLKRDGQLKIKMPTTLFDEEGKVYSLPISEYSKRDICTVCNTSLDSSKEVLTAVYRRYDPGHTWRAATIHKDCFPDSKAEFIINGQIDGDVFCDHCGLPLSPKLIALQVASHHILYDHFTEIENEAIEWIEYLYDNFPQLSGEELTEFYNELEKGYEGPDDSVPIPYDTEEEFEFIKALIRNHSNPGDFSKLVSIIINLKGLDLSRRVFAETFMKGLTEFFPEVPENYDVDSRIEAIWTAAQKIIHDYEIDIRKLYEKLLGPIGSIYNRIQPHWVIYDDSRFAKKWDRRDGADLKNMEWDHGKDLYSQVITIRDQGKVYHPYCAEKLGLTNQSHGHDKTEKR